MRHKPNKGSDSRMFRRTATRTRQENLSHRSVPRGGTRH